MTERKIDAIGNLKAKKEQELLGLTGGKRKTEYKPPATAPCSSATSLETHHPSRDAAAATGVKFIVPLQHTLSHRMNEDDGTACTTSSTEYELKVCEASIEANKAPSSSAATSTYTGTQSQEGDENDGGSSPYYCSTCQDSVAAGVVDVERRRDKTEQGNSSMAVECETIPTASSLSTVIGTVLSQPNHVTRSQSEHHHVNANKQPSQKRLSTISAWTHVQNYSHIVRNLRYSSKFRSTQEGSGNAASKATNSAVHAGSWGASNHIYSSINPPLSTATSSYFPVAPQSYGSRTVSSSRREEGSGRPNTPVSSVTNTTTDTDGEKEKWV